MAADESLHRAMRAVLVGCLLLAFVLAILFPIDTSNEEGWIDQLSGFVLRQKDLDETASTPDTVAPNYDPYIGQLLLVRHVFRSGDYHATYVAMNRLMEMLEATEYGISREAADAIWDYCDRVTPTGFHDAERHLTPRGSVRQEGQGGADR